jgi:hypothetical protein
VAVSSAVLSLQQIVARETDPLQGAVRMYGTLINSALRLYYFLLHSSGP